jgi:hypothetical protein
MFHGSYGLPTLAMTAHSVLVDMIVGYKRAKIKSILSEHVGALNA